MPRPAPTRTSRKAPPPITRAFLFMDLRGYTDFVERHGDAAAARLLRDYRALVRREVARSTGAEVKTEGDSFYVVFDSASAALDCAVAVQRRARARNEKEGAHAIAVGIGLHAGETVAFDQQFVGSAVNVAARLASQAAAGEIVVSDTLRGLIRTSAAHPLADRGELALKGVAEPIRAWTVEWGEARAKEPSASLPLLAGAARPVAPSAGQLVCPIVVGRDADRQRAQGLLDAAAAGRGQTLVVAGEAGVGKSAFVREVTDLATARGFRLLYGATLESDGGLPYAPFLAAVRSGFRGIERDRLGRVLAQAAPDLAELFPELATRTRAGASVEAEQNRVAVAFQGLFATFAREAPVLLAIEDLHWADEASLALLQHLSRELRDSRVLLLATYRSDEMHRRHPFLRVLAALQRERLATEIALRRLDREQVRELIRATLAVADATVTVSDDFRDALYGRSEGNPYFTEELLKSLVESGGVYYRDDAGWHRKPIEELEIPGSIKEAVRQRVERLSEDARATLAVAAVIGLQIPFDALRAACGLDEDVVEAHLREAIESQLVVEIEGDDERYGFRHALTREVVYDDLLVRERKRLHRGVAEALAGVATTEPSVLAHHLLAAGDGARAVPHLLEAADRAQRAGAPREAAAHYGRAIEVGVPDERLAEVVERQAEAYFLVDPALAIKAANEALALYRERGDRRGQSRTLRLAGRAHFFETRLAEAAELTRQAIDVLDGEECAELARATAQQAGLLMTAGQMRESLPLAERAIALGRRLDDPWTLAHALVTKGSALRTDEDALGYFAEGRELAIRHGIVEAAVRAYNNASLAMIGAGRPAAERLAFIEEGVAYGRRQGVERGSMSFLYWNLSFTQWAVGRWEAASVTAGSVDEASPPYVWILHDRARAMVAREGPRSALAIYDEMAKRSFGSAGPAISRATALAAGYAEAGEVARAREWLTRVDELTAPYPRGSEELATPRGVLGAGALTRAAAVALVLDEPRWIDEAEAEIRPGPIAAQAHAIARAARAVLARDAAACAGALLAALDGYEHVGLDAYGHEYVVICASQCLARGVRLGPEWAPLLARTRAFAEKVGARWWLAEIAKAEAGPA